MNKTVRVNTRSFIHTVLERVAKVLKQAVTHRHTINQMKTNILNYVVRTRS